MRLAQPRVEQYLEPCRRTVQSTCPGLAKWLLPAGLLFILLQGILPAAAAPPMPAPEAQLADQVLVLKSERRLLLLRAGRVIAAYGIALGRNPAGHKQQQGDGRTPEGFYRIDWRNPQSRYHLSLHISYPAPTDRSSADRRGVDPGGMIMVHGLPNGMDWLGESGLSVDWTEGCIAVTNKAIRDIWRRVPDGTPIEIRP